MPHEHLIVDDDSLFVIDGNTKKVKFQGEELPTIVQFDHLSETMTFSMPRYIEGHDMKLCNVVQIHFTNISADGRLKAQSFSDIKELMEDGDDKLQFCWGIPGDATQYDGDLYFIVAFKCVNEESGAIEYRWNTALNADLIISPGLNNTNGWFETQFDFLEIWKNEVFDDAVNKALTTAKESGEFNGEDGEDGASVTVSNVSESTASGGDNVVTFSDGNSVTIKNGLNGQNGKDGSNGKDGATGTPGKTAYEYAKAGGYPGTEAQFNALLAGFPTEAEQWTFTLEDGSTVTRQVFIR